MSVATLQGITASVASSRRLTTRVLTCGDANGVAVLFLHGNISSATWWEETMLALPGGFFGIAPDMRGYGEADRDKTIDATRGMGDLSDDAAHLLDALDIGTAVVVGSSMGGSVIWRMIADHSDRIHSAVVVNPGSPYGYGGTKGDDGVAVYEDFAGSGAGLINPEMVSLFAAGDTTTGSPVSPRSVLRSLIVKVGYIPEREDAHVGAMLSTHLGPEAYPGDAVTSENWPFTAPGIHGAANALSPRWAKAGVTALEASRKPPVLWIRGAHDMIISDGGPLDPGIWGSTGLIPGFPGTDVYPPQPMVAQTRAWLHRYQNAGGSYREVVLENSGHVPYIDDAQSFNGVFHAHLRSVSK